MINGVKWCCVCYRMRFLEVFYIIKGKKNVVILINIIYVCEEGLK